MYRVLVADDEPIERSVLQKKLTAFFGDRIEVYLAENGLQAFGLFDEKNCNVAILDISMPGMTGLEVAESIRKSRSKCGIIFLTAFDEFNYAKKAIEVRALDYLLKPVSDEELISAIEEAFSICDNSEGDRYAGESDDNRAFDLEEDKPGDLVRKAKNYIDTHYMEDISLQDVADVIGYSDVYFCKLFKQNFGKSFIIYLNELRIDKAKEMLANPSINVKDVSGRAGYRDPNYFTRVFKRMTGTTPTDYRLKFLSGNGQ